MTAKYLLVGTGYIGQEIASRFRGNADFLQSSSTRSGKGISHLDLAKPEDFDYALIDSSTTIFLAAAISSPDLCAKEYSKVEKINVHGSSEFIHRALDRGARVIFFSTDTVYGGRDDDFNETATCNPVGEYAQMKHEVEQAFFGHSSFKSIRLSYVFSSEDKFTKYIHKCFTENETADIFDPFNRSVIHRIDVVQGVINLAEKWSSIPQQVINFGGPEVLSRVNMVEIMAAVKFHGLKFSITHPPEQFFKNRPRIISMKSPLLGTLLGRPASRFEEAARIELSS